MISVFVRLSLNPKPCLPPLNRDSFAAAVLVLQSFGVDCYKIGFFQLKPF